MSIFKETFPAYIRQQMAVREAVISAGLDGGGKLKAIPLNTGLKAKDGPYGDLTIDSHAFYTNSVNRQCVIRMSSGVDLDSKNEVLENTRYERPKDMLVSGMAKRYILQGGTLVTAQKGDEMIFANRKGFPGTFHKGKQRTMGFAYGDPMIRGDATEDGYGIVPMPGITSANIRTKSAYGSLRTAQVEFVCYNQRQLEILEMLYMRPGYTVMLEWGWCPYVNNFGEIVTDFPTAEGFFDSDAVHTQIENSILATREETGGNYDGFLGIVKNFEYKLRDDGGYDCTTELIARGEVLEGLKLNKEGVFNEEKAKEDGESGWENKTTLEIIIDDITKFGELTDELNDNWFQGGLWDEYRYRDKWRALRTTLFEKFGDLLEKDENGKPKGGLFPYVIPKNTKWKGPDGKEWENNNTNASYIRWDALCVLLNAWCIPHTPKSGEDKNDPLFQMVWAQPVKTDQEGEAKISPHLYCKIKTPLEKNVPKLNNKWIDYSVLDMSLDPSVCLLPHQIYDLGGGSFNVKGTLKWAAKPFAWLIGQKKNIQGNEGDWYNYELPPEDQSREIASIYLNVEHLKGICRSLAWDAEGKENPDFTLHSFLEKLWNDVSTATGNTHDFQMNVSDHHGTNNIRIIDYAFTDDPELNLDDINVLNIQSPNSIVRDVAYNTSIPSSLSATIAIAAQAPSSVDDVESVTWNALNKNIRNRFAEFEEGKEEKPSETQIKTWADSLDADLQTIYDVGHKSPANESTSGTLVRWRTDMLQGEGQEVDEQGTAVEGEKIDEMKGALRAMQAAADRCHKKYGVTDVLPGRGQVYRGQARPDNSQPRSAIIPLKFNCKMDGIGGIVIGNVFKLPADRLPRGYEADDVHFIVMGEEQNIDGQDWTTTINGHLVLLGQDEDGLNDMAWDVNEFNEKQGVFTADEHADIDAEQYVVDPDMESVGKNDYVYLKIDKSHTNARKSYHVNNETDLTDMYNDNNIGMFDKGNGGMLLGKVKNWNHDTQVVDTWRERIVSAKDYTLSGFKSNKAYVKESEEELAYLNKEGAIGFHRKEKVYKIRAKQDMSFTDSNGVTTNFKKGEWVPVNPDTFNEKTPWYKIALDDDALDEFNIGWVMNHDGYKTKNGKQVNKWRIDKNGADGWSHILTKTHTDGAWLSAANVFSDKCQWWSHAIKEDYNTYTWVWKLSCYDWSCKWVKHKYNYKYAREYLTNDGNPMVWMRIDVIQATKNFTVDPLFENAQPEIDGIAVRTSNLPSDA